MLASAAPAAAAEKRTARFTLAVGYNGTPPGEPGLEPLKFADDDAAAMYRLARELGQTGILLAEPDADTRRRLPDLTEEARPPTLAELRRAVAELNAAIGAAKRAGAETTLLLFFSGHGVVGGEAGLAMADGRLTHDRLYDEILAELQADVVHLVVDACHAEAVVRPRDLRATSVPTPAEDLGTYLEQRTLARFPHVGALVASTTAEQTQEWDAYRSGVFSHEVLSALRGGADIDGDHRIEYSEVAAFLSAANRNVVDPRARPTVLVRAPSRRPHAAVVELSRSERAATLGGRAAALGSFYVEDARGNRLCSLNAEPGHRVELLLPAGVGLFLRSKQGEAETTLAPRSARAFDELVWRPQEARARGAVERSLRQGLFASRFGPSYYSGFVDRSEDLVAVAIPAVEIGSDAPPAGKEPRSRAGAWAAWGAAVPLTVAAGVFGGLALNARSDVLSARFERDSTIAHDRYVTYGATAIGFAAGAVVAGVVGYVLWRR
jgi:hypothetical protein